jgi:hypothetical protein
MNNEKAKTDKEDNFRNHIETLTKKMDEISQENKEQEQKLLQKIAY